MYQEVLRIERSFFYGRNLHGTNAFASQTRIENNSPKYKPSGFVRWRAFRNESKTYLLSQCRPLLGRRQEPTRNVRDRLVTLLSVSPPLGRQKAVWSIRWVMKSLVSKDT
jgi:hypothetical protein